MKTTLEIYSTNYFKLYLNLIFLIVFNGFGIAQNNFEDSLKPINRKVSYEVVFGKLINNKPFYNQINTFDSYHPKSAIHYIGISVPVGYMGQSEPHIGASFSYLQVLPKKITINDSIPSKMNGFMLSMNLYGIDLASNSSNFALIIGTGVKGGRLRISTDTYRSQKNSFFCSSPIPHAKIHNKTRLSISIKSNYQLDVTKNNWKPIRLSNKSTEFPITPLNLTGLNLQIGVNWRFKN